MPYLSGCNPGGTGKESGKRHPTLGDNVVVGAGAKVLGISRLAITSDWCWISSPNVPSDCTVVGVPGRIIYRSGVRVNP